MYDGYIYKITNNINDKIYIGQTRVTVHIRYQEHLRAVKDNRDTYLYRAMRKYGVDNFTVEVVESISCKTKDELIIQLNTKEIYYIKKYNSNDSNFGYNMTRGGDNTSDVNMKPCDAYDKNGLFLFSCESVAEMSRTTNVSSMSIIHCCNGQSASRTDYVFRWVGENFDKYVIETEYKNGISLYCFSENGQLLCEYNTIGAAEKDLGINRNCIKQALVNNSLTHHYYFNTENEFNYIKPSKNKIPVDLYSYDTREYIGSYDSITAALVDLGISGRNHNSIHKCLDGKNNYAYGYIWRYRGDPVDKYPVINNRVSLMKPINVFDLEKHYLYTCISLAKTEETTGVNRDMISLYIRGLGSSEKTGYYFYYANDPNQPDSTKVTNITAQELFSRQVAQNEFSDTAERKDLI